jgi:hypothetical protein
VLKPQHTHTHARTHARTHTHTHSDTTASPPQREPLLLIEELIGRGYLVFDGQQRMTLGDVTDHADHAAAAPAARLRPAGSWAGWVASLEGEGPASWNGGGGGGGGGDGSEPSGSDGGRSAEEDAAGGAAVGHGSGARSR